MFGILSRIALAGATKLSQLSSLTSTASSSLLQLTTSSLNGGANTSYVNTVVQKRSKCHLHYFVNRWMARDYKRRKMVTEYYPLRQRYIALKRCSVLPKEFQEVVSEELHAFPKDSSFTRLRPRCILTSRPRWVLTQYRLSRIQWRLLADYNKLSGVLRSCW